MFELIHGKKEHDRGLRKPPAVRPLPLFLVLFSLAGCDEQALAPNHDSIPVGIRLATPVAHLDRGDTARITATLVNGAGVPTTSGTFGSENLISWQTSDPSIASISRSGLLVGHRDGSIMITASAGDLMSQAQLSVSSKGKSVTIAPQVDTIYKVDHTLQLSATVLNGSGREMANASPTWVSLNTDVASVDATGLVRALAAGTALITATAQGNTDTATVVVLLDNSVQTVASVTVDPGYSEIEIGAATQFTAMAKDGSGSNLSAVEMVWSTSDASVATVDQKGMVTANAAGAVIVRATVEGKSGSATLSVPLPTPPAVAAVLVSPENATAAVGEAVQFTASAVDSAGQAISEAGVVWSSSNTMLASVDANGRVTAKSAGEVLIRATASGVTGEASLVIGAPPPTATPITVAAIDVTPAAAEIAVGETTQLSGTVFGSDGDVMPDVEVTWSSSNPAVASVSAVGAVTGLAPGSVTIVAATADVEGTASLTVVSNAIESPVRSGAYVSPEGSSAGTGAIDRPWDLQTALSHPSSILAGDTIWLRGGTYRGEFRSRLTGTATAPIVVRQYPGERATIDGSLTTERGYTWFWGFEVMSSDPNRVSSQSGSSPSDLGDRVNAGITTGSSPGVRFINLVVHDASNGIRFWTHAVDSEIYGAILYNNGWQGPDRGHGHGIYTQNGHVTSSIKRIEDVISFNNFSTGMKAYGSGNAYVTGYRVTGNVMFNNGSISTKPGPEWNILLGQESGGRGLADIVASHNVAWHDNATTRSFELGYNSINQDVVAEGNYVRGLAPIKGFHRVTWRNNTVVSDARIVEMILRSGQTTANYTSGGNRYFGSTSSPFRYTPDGGSAQNLSFAQWKSTTGLDGSSSHSTAAPSDLRVIVRPNKYESGRANVTVINPAGYGSVSVDLSSVLKTGDRFEVRNAQDFYAAPVAGGTYGGGSISLPMTGLSVAQPIGNAPVPATPTGPELNVFVVLRIG
jgi:uncharacterized protein YjdB